MRVLSAVLVFVITVVAITPAYAAPVSEIEAWLQYVDEYMVYKTGMGYSSASTIQQVASASGLSEYQAASAVRSTTEAVKTSGVKLPAGVSAAQLAGGIVVTAGLSIAGGWLASGLSPEPQFYYSDGTEANLLDPANWGRKVFCYTPDGWFRDAEWADGEVPHVFLPPFEIPSDAMPVYTDWELKSGLTYPRAPTSEPYLWPNITTWTVENESSGVFTEDAAYMLAVIVDGWSQEAPIRFSYGVSGQERASLGHPRNYVTGQTYTGDWSTNWFFRAGYDTYTENTFSNRNGATAWANLRQWYDGQMASLISAGLVTVTLPGPTTVPGVNVPVPGPLAFPGTQTFIQTDTSVGTYTPDELEDEWKMPAWLPSPVADAITEADPDVDVDLPVGVPSGVARFISSTWSDITAPVVGLFEGLDIFWPFHYMAERG
ncbi:MAG: hypothetical protein RBR02_09840 [Desulfuromonadaceae bacterium]|nr:hypothetical protein [Desulfuromonadaceae bacterium]